MKSLKILIKLAKQELDRLRKDMSPLLDFKDDLIRQRQQLKSDLKREYDYVVMYPDAKASYDIYAMSVGVKVQALRQREQELDMQISELQERIADAFADLKKYEILLDKKMEEVEAEEARKEQITLDEMGITGYLRKEKELE